MEVGSGHPDAHVARVVNLCISYGSHLVVRDFNAEFLPGEVVLLSGPNASGKTTLIRALASLTSGMNCSGTIEYRNRGAQSRAPIALAVPIEALPQQISVSVACEIVARTLPAPRRQRAVEYANRVGLHRFLHTRIGELSAGTKQKACVALALLAPADLFLLDESMSAMDIASTESTLAFVRDIVKSERKAALIVTHDVHAAKPFADKVLSLDAAADLR